MESVAQRHLFDATRADFQVNLWICHALNLLQSDSWPHRIRHLLDLSFGDYAVSMCEQRVARDPVHRATRWGKLRRALSAWHGL